MFLGVEMKPFTHSTQPGQRQRSKPKNRPKGKWVILTLDERGVLFWNLENGEQVIQNLSLTKHDLQNDISFLNDMLN